MGLLVPTGKFFPNNKPLDVSSSKTEREGKMCVMRRGAEAFYFDYGFIVHSLSYVNHASIYNVQV